MFIQLNKNTKKYLLIFLCLVFNQLVMAQVKYQSKVLYHHKPKLLKSSDTSYKLGFNEDGGRIFGPAAIDVDKDGNLYILDTQKRRIIKTDPNGNNLKTIKIDEGMKQTGADLCIDNQNNIYVLDQNPKIFHYYKQYIETKNSFGLRLFEIRKYNQEGKLLYRIFLAIEKEWRHRNRFAPQKLNVDYKGRLYFEFSNQSFQISFKGEAKSTEYGKLFIGEISEIYEGTINPWDKECRILTTSKKETLKKTIGDRKFCHINADINKYITDDLKYEKIINQDHFNTVYVLFNDRSRLKKRDNKFDDDIIMIFNRNGEQIATLDQLPSNKEIDFFKNIAIDNQGNIFYMAVNDNGIELVKYYK